MLDFPIPLFFYSERIASLRLMPAHSGNRRDGSPPGCTFPAELSQDYEMHAEKVCIYIYPF